MQDGWILVARKHRNHTHYDATKSNKIAYFKLFFGETIKNLGYFIWNDDSIRNVDPKKITVELLLSSVTDDQIEKPPLINKMAFGNSNEITRLSTKYKLTKDAHKIRTIPCVVSSNTAITLHIAQKRGLDLNDADFFLGGSTLSVLAEKKIPKGRTYLVQRFGNVISITKLPNYQANLDDPGYQFERMMRDDGSSSATKSFETLSLRSIHDDQSQAKFNVIFSAELDGQSLMDSESLSSNSDARINVELKIKNPKNWGSRTILQMISSNSKKLYYGKRRSHLPKKSNSPSKTETDRSSLDIIDVLEYDEEDIISKISLEKINSIKKNIIHCLNQLKEQYSCSKLKENELYELNFTNQDLSLTLANKHYKKHQIRAEVMEELLK